MIMNIKMHKLQTSHRERLITPVLSTWINAGIYYINFQNNQNEQENTGNIYYVCIYYTCS